jgi:hypothetical protein
MEFLFVGTRDHTTSGAAQWRTQDFVGGGGSTNSVDDRENGDLGAVAP